MVPRADIVAMRADVSLDEAIALIRADGHSRLPVYRETLDDVIGIVHQGRLLAEGTLNELRTRFGHTDLEEIFVSAVES